MAASPRLVVVSGPSGVGKTTICDLLLKRPDFERVITATTRAPRPGERPGVDYFFLSPEEFRAWEEQGRFLESAEVFGRRYGSLKDQAEEILARGSHVLLNIDVQGAAQVRRCGLPCLLVFLAPPSMEELKRRLAGRGTDPPERIARRLAAAGRELERSGEFDLVVVNDDREQTAREIRNALL